MFQTTIRSEQGKKKDNTDSNSDNKPKINFGEMLKGHANVPNLGSQPAQMMVEDEEEKPTQKKAIQKKTMVEEEEELQTKETPERQSESSVTSGTKVSMPDGVKDKMENSFGTDFSSINIHKDSEQATNMGALAYTQGNDVHFAPGQYNPNTQGGQELIGHELTHVVQQRQGRVKPTKEQRKDLAVNDNPLLENEADTKGKKAANGQTVNVVNSISEGLLQAKWSERKKRKKFEKAKAKHAKNINRLKKLIQIGLSSTDIFIRNSCEAVKKKVVPLYALTTTGDSKQRQIKSNKLIKQYNARGGRQLELDSYVRYFPDPFSNSGGDIYSTPVYYNWQNINFDLNIHKHRAAAAGFAKGGVIAIPEPANRTDDNQLLSYISHEVQHIMDRHNDDTGISNDLSSYKSEYRAYSYANATEFSSFSNTTIQNREGYNWLERQYQIFNHIRTNYKYVNDAWNDPDPVKQGAFRNAVVAYINPDTEGANKLNSIRINYFYDALSKISKEPLFKIPKTIGLVKQLPSIGRGLIDEGLPDKFKTKPGSLLSPEVQNLINISFFKDFSKLQKEDAQYILNEGDALQEKMKSNLEVDAYSMILKLLYSVK